MKRLLLVMLSVLGLCAVRAQSFRNAGPVETDSQGHVIEKLDYDRKFSLKAGETLSAKEYREELAERERMKKVAREAGPWFDSIQQLELDQQKGEEEHDADGGGLAGDGTGTAPGYTGKGMWAYIEAMRIFNSDTSDKTSSVAKEAKQLRAALEELLYRRGGEVICGPTRGVSIKYPLELFLVRYQSMKAQTLPMEELYAAKSADLWPGAVPKDAERVTKKVIIYEGEGGWISTGLYVPPGEVITLKCGSLKGTLKAQIGVHSDKLEPKIVPFDEDGNPMDNPYDPVAPNLMKVKMGWQQVTDNRPLWRWPDMVRNFTITKKSAKIGHVLGGVLWLKWEGGSGSRLEVEVSGCVQMPWFRLGLDTNEDWVNTISKYPAPWAEIQTKTIIFTVESRHVRDIKNMVALAQWWGKAAAIMLRVTGRALPTDSEPHNLRTAKREWGILDKKLVQMNPDAPPDTEELARAAREQKVEAAAKAKETAAQSAEDAEQARIHAERYGGPVETVPVAIPTEQEAVPEPPRKTRVLKKATRENEGKFTPFRIVDDTQISIGAGHSGYPIMCIHWGAGMMNLDGLQRSGSWGALHEMGHNMGQGANGIFALPGNTEVVNNFYGTCVMNLLNGTRFTRIHPSSWNGVAKRVADRTPDLWSKCSGGERLVFYMTLAHFFGVESVVTVVNDKSDKYPTDALGDRMCCAWSVAVGRDLTPYFDIWGIPLSKAAYKFTENLPPWPTASERDTIFVAKDPEGDSRYDRDLPLDISSPEEVKTRRQLREGLKK